MKKAIIIVFVFLSVVSWSQNLVPNPSFETYINCPQGPSTFEVDVVSWSNPDTATPDYYNVCNDAVFPMPSMDVPNNIQGFQNARTGVGYGGLIASEQTFGFDTDYREYLQAQLTSSLTAGQTYCIEFYWNLSGKSVYYVEEMGVYLSNTVTNLQQYTVLPFIPQVSVSGTPLDDTTNWVLFQENYLAVGGEEYLIIGNFNAPAATTSGVTGTPSDFSTGGDFAYYYIEDVSVTAGTCVPSCDATINAAGPFCVSSSPITLTSLSSGGTWTGTGITNTFTGEFDPSISGSGTFTITYTLPCGSSNTVDVIVDPCTGIIFSDKIELKIYPNPVDNQITILTGNLKRGSISIVDITGREIVKRPFSTNKVEINMIDLLSKGNYFIKVFSETKELVGVKKIIKN